MKCLLIGGHAAGRVMDVAPGQPFISVPEPITSPTTLLTIGGASVDGAVRYSVYKLDCAFDKKGNQHVVYVEENSGDPLHTLMDFYASADHSKATT